MDLIDAVGDSEVMKTVLAEVLSLAAGKWANGEEFLSVNIKEQLPDAYKTALDEPLAHLSETTKDTVCDDLRDLACSIETISDTYVYLHKMSRTTGDDRVGQEELKADTKATRSVASVDRLIARAEKQIQLREREMASMRVENAEPVSEAEYEAAEAVLKAVVGIGREVKSRTNGRRRCTVWEP